MKRQFSIVIAGAGVVGLTLAALLLKSRNRDQLNITIVDGADEPGFSIADDIALRVSAISTGSAEILSQSDSWHRMTQERICAYSDMRVWDSTGAVEGPETLHFSASEYALPELGFIVENSLIQSALLEALQAARQSVSFNSAIRSVDLGESGYSVKLTDGSRLQPDLLIGADGGASFVRKQAGIVVDGWAYNQTAFVTHLLPEIAHGNTAWQRFLPAGPIALLPLKDGRVSTVWTTTPEEAERAKTLSDDDLADELTANSDAVLGRLTPCGPRGAFPLRAQHSKEYVRQGLALIGDAAHSVHPLAGQGANLGISDAACLAELIDEAIANGEHIGDYRVLRRYERARKGANQTMLRFIDGINRLFGATSPAVSTLRSSGMRMFNRAGPLRDHAVKVALGLTE